MIFPFKRKINAPVFGEGIKTFGIIFIIFYANIGLFAQSADSLKLQNVISDSLITSNVKSASVDSVEKTKKYDVDDIVFANSSDSLSFDVTNKKMYLYGKGELKYKTSDLKSADIAIDFTNNSLEAKGAYAPDDTTFSNLIDTPVLSEAGQVYEGTTIKYNFKTQQGYISLAKNTDKDKSYRGEKVKKVDKKTFFIEDGTYTTCDADTPHTHFTASKMKVIQNDKIIANWIFMYVGGVPLPIPLPFAVFPNESGRRSGIIVPTYGYDSQLGYTFRNFGYFWAMSDYMDLMLGADYYTMGGYRYRTRYRYKKRYSYSGNLNAEVANLIQGEKGDPDYSENFNWNLSLRHTQEINPTSSLNANLSFMSNSYLKQNTLNYNDRVSQTISSSANYSKRWDESGTSLTLGYSRNQNLANGNITEVLPSLSFNMSQKYPFKRPGVSRNDQKWYEYIGLSYGSDFRNERRKTAFTNTVDSISGYERNIRGGIQHRITINASPKLGYFNISPSINYREKWYDKKTKREYLPEVVSDSTIYYLNERDVKEINFVRTFDFNLSASTKIYGMAEPGILGVKAFRHTLTPSISYNYQPDFRNEFWNYYDEVYNPNSEKIERYDKYQNGIFSGVGAGESQSINFSLGNLFEMKTEKDPTDTSSQEKKITLLNLNASTGYNFAADSLRLSDLNVSFRTQIGSIISLNGSSNFTFYDYNVINTASSSYANKVNKFLLSEGKGLLRMTNLNFNLSTTLAGDKISGEERDGKNQKVQPENEEDFANIEDKNRRQTLDEESSNFTIPWNLGLNLNYNLNKSHPEKSIVTANTGINLSLSLSQNWRLTFRGNYDLEEKKLNSPQVTVYRDLHCWEMNFTWTPIGVWRGFRFEIRLKAPELSDLKVTKSKDIYSRY